MRSLYVESLGTFTSVGVTAPQTVGSLRLGYARHHEVPIFVGGRKPLVAATTAIPTDAAQGAVRLQAMGAFALREAAQGRLAALPLLLCLPERASAHHETVFEGIVRQAATSVDPAMSKIFVGGKSIFVTALLEADRLLASAKAAACYVGCVDSMLDLDRLRDFRAAGRLLDGHNPDGFIPGEGAVVLRVTRRRGRETLAWIRGVGVGEERAPFGGDLPNTGVGLTAALKDAVRDGQVHTEEIAFLGHSASGERLFFHELSLASQRLRIRRKEPLRAWTPALSVGEIGVCGGPLLAAYLSFMISKGALADYQDPTQRARTGVLCALSDADVPRGAFFISEAPRG